MVKYVNSKGQTIDLSKFPIRLKEAVFHAYEWNYEGTEQRFGVAIDYFKKDTREYDMVVSFSGGMEKRKQLANDFCDITEYDVKNNSPGTLYVEDYSIQCFIIESSTEPTEFFRTDRSMRVLCPYPFWVKETKYQFLPSVKTTNNRMNRKAANRNLYTRSEIQNGAILSEFAFDMARIYEQKTDYPMFDLPFDFLGSTEAQMINNASYMPCNFQMVIYGFVQEPTVIIGDHTYRVYATALSGERIVIDSRDKTVIKIGRFGEITNLYNLRNKTQSIFEKIQEGNSVVTWPGTYGIDITLFDERSEPKWNSRYAAKT